MGRLPQCPPHLISLDYLHLSSSDSNETNSVSLSTASSASSSSSASKSTSSSTASKSTSSSTASKSTSSSSLDSNHLYVENENDVKVWIRQYEFNQIKWNIIWDEAYKRLSIFYVDGQFKLYEAVISCSLSKFFHTDAEIDVDRMDWRKIFDGIEIWFPRPYPDSYGDKIEVILGQAFTFFERAAEEKSRFAALVWRVLTTIDISQHEFLIHQESNKLQNNITSGNDAHLYVNHIKSVSKFLVRQSIYFLDENGLPGYHWNIFWDNILQKFIIFDGKNGLLMFQLKLSDTQRKYLIRMEDEENKLLVLEEVWTQKFALLDVQNIQSVDDNVDDYDRAEVNIKLDPPLFHHVIEFPRVRELDQISSIYDRLMKIVIDYQGKLVYGKKKSDKKQSLKRSKVLQDADEKDLNENLCYKKRKMK